MPLFKSKGYFHLKGITGTKHLTSEKDVLVLPEEYAAKIYIPAVEPAKGMPLTMKVSVGDEVKVGTLIATRILALGPNKYELPVYSTVSGKVVAEENLFHGGLGRPAKHLVIENDHKYENVKVCEPFSVDSEPEVIIDAMQKLGLVGLGGAGFPTFIKYKGVKGIDTLVINGVECEPFLTTDYKAMIADGTALLEGVSLMLKASGASRALVCFKKNKTAVLEALNPLVGKYPGVELKLVPDVYPMGWEKLLVKTATGRTYEGLPATAHVIINNAQTAIELAKSSKTGYITSKKVITVSGEGVKENANVLVPVGTKVSEIVRYMDGYAVEEGVVLLGGPMCSKGLMNDNVAITTNVNGLTILKKVVRPAQQCLRCGACTDHCPNNLQPVEIKIAVEHKDVQRMIDLNATSCIGCGLCSYICPSFIEVNDFVKKAKMFASVELTKRQAAAKAAEAKAALAKGAK